MPGHAQAAIAAYPWLGSTDVPTEVATYWGVKPYLFNPTDSTFDFLEKVLSEVFTLFPGEYVHIGGDEAIKDQWKANPKIQAQIRELGLKNENELQSWFIKRIQKFVNSKGKKIIGWDEITEGGAPPDAGIMYWRSEFTAPLEDAVKGNHPVVATPTEFCYLDYYQAFPPKEPHAIGGYLTLDKVYSMEPIPSFCTPEQVRQFKGTQANLWTEYISTPEHAEYMLYPRLAALAEVAWTKKELKDYEDFTKRLPTLLKIYKEKNINYCQKQLPCIR
jgi:hexosaminidase